MITLEFELRPLEPLDRRAPGRALEAASYGLHRLHRNVEPPTDDLVEAVLNALRTWEA